MSDHTLLDILRDYRLDKNDLNCKCDSVILAEMAPVIVGDWSMIGRFLIDSEKLTEITDNNIQIPKPGQKSDAMLQAWLQKRGKEATYLELAQVLLRRNKRSWVEKLCEIVISSRQEDAQESNGSASETPTTSGAQRSIGNQQRGENETDTPSQASGAQKSNGSQQKGKNESEAPTTSGIDLAKLPSNIVRPARPHWKNIKVVQRSQHPDGTYHLLFKFDHKNEQNIEVSVTKSAERLTFKIVKCDHLEINSESEYCCHFEVANEAHEAVFEDIVKGEQLSETHLRFLLDNVVSVVTNKIHYASHPPQYGIFLSHKSKDKPIINAVKEGLQFIGYKTWIDQENIGAGEVSTIAMKNGIDKCASFLAWMNEEFFGSEFCKSELKYALQKDKIIFTFGNHHELSGFFTGDFDQLGDRNIVDPTEKSLFEILRLIDDALHK